MKINSPLCGFLIILCFAVHLSASYNHSDVVNAASVEKVLLIRKNVGSKEIKNVATGLRRGFHSN